MSRHAKTILAVIALSAAAACAPRAEEEEVVYVEPVEEPVRAEPTGQKY